MELYKITYTLDGNTDKGFEESHVLAQKEENVQGLLNEFHHKKVIIHTIEKPYPTIVTKPNEQVLF